MVQPTILSTRLEQLFPSGNYYVQLHVLFCPCLHPGEYVLYQPWYAKNPLLFKVVEVLDNSTFVIEELGRPQIVFDVLSHELRKQTISAVSDLPLEALFESIRHITPPFSCNLPLHEAYVPRIIVYADTGPVPGAPACFDNFFARPLTPM